MNVLQLVTLARRRLGDIGDGNTDYWQTDDSDCKWKNDELVSYLTEAQLEYCSRVPIIDSTTVDDGTDPLCELDVVSGTSTYTMSPKILAITRFKLEGEDNPTPQLGEHQRLNDTNDSWPTDILWYQLDKHMNTLELIGTPTADDTASLTVERLPLNDFDWATNTDVPEIREQDHVNLIEWVLHLAYLKGDEDTFDQSRSDLASTRFDRKVGDPINAREEQVLREWKDIPVRTRIQW